MKGIELLKSILQKYKWTIIGLIVVGLLFPFGLNWLVMHQSSFAIAGKPETWIAFWPSYLSAIASFGMIALTAITLLFNSETLKTNKEALEYNKEALKNNKEQLDELKRQWEEEHKPNVSVSFSQLGTVAYLRIVNTSIVEVKNLRIKGKFFAGEEESNFFNMGLLEKFNIDIEPNGIRNIILHNDIEPLTDNFYFILELLYEGLDNPKVVKVYCNNIYIVGDVIQGNQLIESIKRTNK